MAGKTTTKSKKPLRILLIIAIQVMLIGILLLSYSYFSKTPMQYTVLLSDGVRMQTLIEALLPAIHTENAKIREDKILLERGRKEDILELARKYDVDMQESEIDARLHFLKERVDEIPASLLIGYAWTATGFGQRKDAIEKNNYFDERDWKITTDPNTPTTYTLTAYVTPEESAKAFMRKVNTALFFEDFRRVRKTQRGYIGGVLDTNRLADKFIFYQGDDKLDVKIQNAIKTFDLQKNVGEK